MTQDTDTSDRPVSINEDIDEVFVETGYILAAIRHREPFRQSKEWYSVHVLVDSCAEVHVRSPRGFEEIAIEPSRNPHLVSASGQTETQRWKISADETARLTHDYDHVPGVRSQGTHHECGQVLYEGERPMCHVSRHEVVSCGPKKLEKCWWTEFEPTANRNAGSNRGNVLAPVYVGGSRGSASELAGHLAAAPRRADVEILMNGQLQGAHAPRGDEEHNAPEILVVASLLGPRVPSKNEIEGRNLLHDPAMPWCDICFQSKGRDACHRQARPEVFPVRQFDCAVAGTYHGQPHFDFMVGTDMNTRSAWASTVLIIGKEDPYMDSSIHSWLSELEQVNIQSDGEPASEVVMRTVQSKGAMMETPTMRDNPAMSTAIQPPEHWMNRTNGTNDTQSNQSLQDPN